MTRARKTNTPNDGMALLQLMPFPAFNPLNWGALGSPRNAVLASLHTTRLAFDAWRASADSMRAMMRLQQDEWLRLLEVRMDASANGARHAENVAAPEGEPSVDPLPPLFNPVMEATRAYGRVGRAFIVAQRDTMRAFTPTPPDQH